ncbi:MAG: choice-of-anchor K domain-containing protein [Spirulinaceae cyanobacterium]
MTMVIGTAKRIDAFAFVGAGEANGFDVVTHQIGYDGTGGNLIIDVGIDPTSLFANNSVTSVINAINTWNILNPTTGNLAFGNNNNIPNNLYDFESAVLHEIGHTLGLDHPNLGFQSGVDDNERNYTQASSGNNGVFDVNPGTDGIIGSADDIRGDDVNLNYFRIADNNPFDTSLGIVDSTTYSRDIANLPNGSNYSTNADRYVGENLDFNSTEAVLQQEQRSDEAQRSLTADDVAGILYSLTGLDEIAGTEDDYTFLLNYAGLTADADIVIDFDETAFAVARSRGGRFLSGTDHIFYENANILFNPDINWFFNEDTTLEGISSSTFINPDLESSPNATVTGIGTNSIEWGVAVDPPVSFDPPALASSLSVIENNFASNLGEAFVAGTITFTNGEIQGGTGIGSVDLLLNTTFDVPQLNIFGETIETLREVSIVNTTNTSDPIASADAVMIQPPIGLDFNFGNSFNVLEGKTATASLIGRIIEDELGEIPVLPDDDDETILDDLGNPETIALQPNQPINRKFSFQLLGFGQVLNGQGFITSATVPEPSSGLSLLALGVMGAGSIARRKISNSKDNK